MSAAVYTSLPLKLLPKNETGAARPLKTGSTRMFSPSVLMRYDECPNQTIEGFFSELSFRSVRTDGSGDFGQASACRLNSSPIMFQAVTPSAMTGVKRRF